MNDDEQIAVHFHDAVSTLEPPVERLVDAATAQGRRRLRMRRGVQALTMCTVLAGGTGIAAVVHSQTPIPTVNQTLISLLPGGTVQSWRPELTTRAGNAIDVIYDDGNGAALITGAVDHPDLPGGHSLSCDVATCTPLSDGSGYLALYQGNGDPNRPGSTGIEWEASVHRDNVVVTISEWNSDDPYGAPTRTEPPLTMDQLTSIAEDPSWPSS
jgi:hypothetical protein